MELNWDCLKSAINYDYSEKSYRICKKQTNLVYFKQSEDDSLDVSRVMTLNQNQEIGREPIDFEAKMDYESLWKVSFAMENVDEEAQDGRRRLKQEVEQQV